MGDILKILYPNPFDLKAQEPGLKNANLKPILWPYCSKINKVLMDYKVFRDFVMDGVTRIKS